jgi:hypothetical protein
MHISVLPRISRVGARERYAFRARIVCVDVACCSLRVASGGQSWSGPVSTVITLESYAKRRMYSGKSVDPSEDR